MPQLTWQKSSFSGGGEGNCVELAATTPDRVHLRESDHPHEITTTPDALANLLHSLKGTPMPQLTWQKSSFSTGGEGECVELAARTPDRIHLRESDHPHEIATATPHALVNLLHALKAGFSVR